MSAGWTPTEAPVPESTELPVPVPESTELPARVDEVLESFDKVESFEKMSVVPVLVALAVSLPLRPTNSLKLD